MYKFLIPLFALALLVGCTTTSSTTTTMNDSSAVSSSATSIVLLKGKHYVTLKTSQGDISLELDADTAPMTVTNFITLAKQGYYDNLTFHRVIPGFMIQGGDPTGNGTGGKSIFGDRFKDEIDATKEPYLTGYVKGTLAMANAGPNTNGSQFFIMETDYPLPPLYTIFGHVTAGQSVVTKIASVERDSSDKPIKAVTFTPTVKD